MELDGVHEIYTGVGWIYTRYWLEVEYRLEVDDTGNTHTHR
jgi:hypothetical protein